MYINTYLLIHFIRLTKTYKHFLKYYISYNKKIEGKNLYLFILKVIDKIKVKCYNYYNKQRKGRKKMKKNLFVIILFILVFILTKNFLVKNVKETTKKEIIEQIQIENIQQTNEDYFITLNINNELNSYNWKK